MSSPALGRGLGQARRGVARSGRRSEDPQRPRRSALGSRGATLLLFALPSLVLLVLLNVYPVIYAGIQSLRNGDLVGAGTFVGLANYSDVLSSSEFWTSARFTLIFSLVGVFGSWVVGLCFALVLNTRPPGSGVLKVLLLLPWIVPVVVSSTAWNFLVATPQSPLPRLLEAVGIENVLFLSSPVLAQVTVCVFKVWISFPFTMMMMSSALASVDVNVYEAARMDGANRRQIFTQVTLPLIQRPTFICWILMTIFCVNDFPTIFLLTARGPVNSTTSLVLLAYLTVFQNFRTGPGVAIAFLMTAVLVVVSTLLYRQIKKASIV